MINRHEVWIDAGYTIFAQGGEAALKVEHLAKVVGISKSSFYHHFVDPDIFMERLLNKHLQQAKRIADKEAEAGSINPELINILLAHKIDLLFNRQLRISANNPTYQRTLAQTNQTIGKHFIRLWLMDTTLNLTPSQAEGLFELALENFFLQLNPSNVNAEWLANYFDNLKHLIKRFENGLDATV